MGGGSSRMGKTQKEKEKTKIWLVLVSKHKFIESRKTMTSPEFNLFLKSIIKKKKKNQNVCQIKKKF